MNKITDGLVAPTEVKCEFLKSSFFVVAVFLCSNKKNREASSVFINGKWVLFSAIATPAEG